MSQLTDNFAKAFLALNPSDRREVAEIVRTLANATPLNESALIKSLGLESYRSTTINFAPVPGSCPTCGR